VNIGIPIFEIRLRLRSHKSTRAFGCKLNQTSKIAKEVTKDGHSAITIFIKTSYGLLCGPLF